MFALGPQIKTFTSDDVLNPFWNKASYKQMKAGERKYT